MNNDNNSANSKANTEKKLGFKKVTIKTGVRAGINAVPTTTIYRHHHTTTAINCGGGGGTTTAINCP